MQTEPVGERFLPASPEAEQAVLGSLLLDPTTVSVVAPYLQPTHFYQEKHGWIYAAILALETDGVGADFVTLTDELDRRGQLQQCGGSPYVMDLLNAVPTAIHVEHYADLVLRLASDRAAIRVAGLAVTRAYEGRGEGLDLLASLTEKERAGYLSGDDEPRWLDDVVDEVVDTAADLQYDRLQGDLVDVDTPWPGLNEIIYSLIPGDYVTVTAAPTVGKSIMLQQILAHNAERGHGSLFITTETRAQNVAARQLGRVAEMSPRIILSGSMTTDSLARLIQTKERAKIGPILVDDKTRAFEQIERRVQQAQKALESRGYRLRLVAVDFIQQLTRQGYDGRAEEIGGITYGLRYLAGRYGLVVVAVSEVDKLSYSGGQKISVANASGSAKIHYSAGISLSLNRQSDDSVQVTVDKNKDGKRGSFTLPPMTGNSPWFG